MAEAGVGTIPLRPDFDGFSARNLSRGIDPAIDGAGRGIKSKLGGVFSAVANLGGGILAGAAIGGFLKGAIDGARESAKINAITEQTIKSMGGASGYTAGQIGELSTKLSNLSGVDDEVIQGGANLLLTFGNISKNGGVFDRTLALANDMSVALGQDMKSSSIQLGKALNDPIKGVSALSRVGVSFTEQQKTQIATLVASGDTLKAQGIILDEVGKQFGGAAEATATPMDKLRTTLGNLQEDVGARLLPVIDRVASYLAAHLPAALDTVGAAFTRVREFLAPFVAQAIAFWPVVMNVVAAIRDNLTPVLIGLGVIVGLAVGPFALLAAGLVYAYTQFESVRTVVAAVVDFFTGTVMPAVSAFAGHIADSFRDLQQWTRENWTAIQEAIRHVVAAIQLVVGGFIDYVKMVWRAWGDDLLRMAATIWNGIRETIDNAIRVVQGIIQTVMALINGDWGRAWDGIKQILGAVWDQIGNIVSTAIGVLKSLIGGIFSSIGALWSAGWDGLKAIVAAAWDAYVAAIRTGIDTALTLVRELPGKLVGAMGDLGNLLVDAGKKLISGFIQGIKDKIPDVKGALGNMTDKLTSWKGPPDKDAVLLYGAGVLVIDGFVGGIRDSFDEVRGVMAEVTDIVVEGVKGAWYGFDTFHDMFEAQGHAVKDYLLRAGGNGPLTDSIGREWGNEYFGSDPNAEALDYLELLYIAEQNRGRGPDLGGRAESDPFYGEDPGTELNRTRHEQLSLAREYGREMAREFASASIHEQRRV